jgi:hypothetical protein
LEMMDNFVWSFNIFQKGGFRQHIFVNIFQIVATFLEMLKKFQHCLLPRLGRRGPRPALWPARESRGEAGEPHVRLRRSSRRAQWGGGVVRPAAAPGESRDCGFGRAGRRCGRRTRMQPRRRAGHTGGGGGRRESGGGSHGEGARGGPVGDGEGRRRVHRRKMMDARD